MSIKGKKFVDLQQRLDEQISKVVIQLQSKVDELETELSEIAHRYPTNSMVVEKLSRFLNLASEPRKQNLISSGSQTIGRPRVVPRWFAEWNDGTTVEFVPNPIRNKLAKILKENPSSSFDFSLNDVKSHIIVRVNGVACQIGNPHKENTSGLKTVGIR